jgi:hypothetical protein
MRGTDTTRGRKDDEMGTQPISFSAQTFSELEARNQKFKRVAWASAFLLVCVLTVLMLELLGIIK